MKIKKIRIKNFRCFKDETIDLNDYTCFVGPNGSGKSSILCALNVFFKEQDNSATDISKLVEEDYFNKNIDEPIEITVTFTDLSLRASEELKDYVRQDELIVTAKAEFSADEGFGLVRHYGKRLGMEEFRIFFEREKSGATAVELAQIYENLRKKYPSLPDVRAKKDKVDALNEYETDHPGDCVAIPSADNFYGVNSTGMLAKFIQWIYVPAVKDAGDEEAERKNSALGKLIERAVKARVHIDEELEQLQGDTLTQYNDILSRHQDDLLSVSNALESRLQAWAHPNARLQLQWGVNTQKSVSFQQPYAEVKTGDSDFMGSLSRMGHGLQRSYLLALLQEQVESEDKEAPRMILGCEEPELYQHPPQARHLATVLTDLTEKDSQVFVTTHSPLFVSGDGFENVRLVRSSGLSGASAVGATLARVNERIRRANGEQPVRGVNGMAARIHQALQPGVAEMFFARVPILVEGLEDVAYITTQLHLQEQWSEFRRLGCHLVPVNCKSNLIKPLAIACELGMPIFVMFDADGDTNDPAKRVKHEKDNKALIGLLGQKVSAFPSDNEFGDNYIIWHASLTEAVKADYSPADYQHYKDMARHKYDHERNLDKLDLFIAEWISTAYADDKRSHSLKAACDQIISYASSIKK